MVSQIHQHFTGDFFVKKNFGAKALRKMVMKFSIGVNFINIIQAAFARTNPKSTKRH